MLCISAGGTSVAAAPLTPADFPYCADVSGQLTTNSLYQVHLPDEILEKSAAGNEDLRLFGPGGKEIPSVIIEEDRPAETVETYSLEIAEYSAGASAAVVTVKLPEKRRPISVIEIDTPDRDFKKQVKLEGSRDKKIWQALADDVIYDFSSQVDLRKTRIAFLKSDFRYYRLRLSDSRPAGAGHPSIRLTYEGLDFSVNSAQKKELRIRKAEGRTDMPKERDVVYDEKVFANPQASTDKDGNTVIILKTGLPLDRLAFDVSNPYYYRTVNLYASDTGKDDSYYLVARRAVYRFPLTSEQHETRNAIETRSPKRQFYKMVIENKNNPQLDIKSITAGWVQKNLYFIALSAAGPNSLCFGNPGLTPPDYDIAHFINGSTLPQHTYEKLSAAAVHENKDYEAPVPGGRRAGMEKVILKVVVVILVIGIGCWLYALMRKISPKKGA